MPSSRQTASVGLSSSTRRRITSRRPRGKASMAASVCASRWRCSAISSGPASLQAKAAARSLPALVVVETLVVRSAAHRVDDLVLQHRRQPRAQGGPAAERGAPREHGFEDIVHGILGQHRVAQAPRREANEIGPMGDHLGDRRWRAGRRLGVDRGGRGRTGGQGGGSVHREAPWVDAVTVGVAPRADLAQPHSQITLL